MASDSEPAPTPARSSSVGPLASSGSQEPVTEELCRLRTSVQIQNQLLELISELQLGFITDNEHRILFERMLEGVLRITASQMGLIAEVSTHESHGLLLRSAVCAEMAEDTSARENSAPQFMQEIAVPAFQAAVQESLQSSSVVLLQLEVPIVPAGLHSIAILPVFSGIEMVGIIGIASRQLSYDAELLSQLDPLLVTYGNLVQALQTRRAEDLALRELRESEERFDLILRAAEIGSWDWNIESGYVAFNQRWAEMLGYGPNELSPRIEAWKELLHPEDAARVLATQEQHLRGETPMYESEHRVRTKSGDWVWIHARGRVSERDEDGRPIRALGTQLDITDRKRKDVELQRAKEASEAANISRGQFLANMSHEIRTPLTAVLGFAQAVQSGHLSDAEQTEALSTIINNGDHLLQVLNDILDLSKIDAGALKVVRERVLLETVIQEIRSLSEHHAHEKGLELRFIVPPGVPSEFFSDQLRLRQILINLIGNAIKFTEFGHVEVAIAFDPKHDQLGFAISDTGIGLSPEHLERAFRPFEQADATTTRKYGGTGLGLVISACLAEMLNGELHGRSELNSGSTFTLTLRGVTIPNAVARTQPAQVAATRKTPTSLSGRVLIADDVRANQRLISFMLQRTGLELSFADNGQAAVEAALGDSFDLILMDIQMPVMDGLTATRLLKQQGVRAPVVAFSASAMPEDIQACLDAGCVTHLAKPFREEEMVSLFSKLLSAPKQEVACAENAHWDETENELVPAAVTDVLVSWLTALPKEIGLLRNAAATQDRDQVLKIAHSMRGTASLLGLANVAERAGAIEQALRASSADTLPPETNQLIDLLAELA